MDEKRKRFCQEYLIDLNATQAAVRSGISKSAASSWACRALKDKEIKEYLQKLMEKRAFRTEITSDRVTEVLARMAFTSIFEMIDPKTGEIREKILPEKTAAINKIKIKITPTKEGDEIIEREVTLCDKVKVLELLGKHLGLFEKEIQKKDRIQIVDDIRKEDSSQ